MTGLQLPTAIVVILGILVPVLLYLIGRKGQTEVTWSGLHSGLSKISACRYISRLHRYPDQILQMVR